jgi:hypothetical protein
MGVAGGIVRIQTGCSLLPVISANWSFKFEAVRFAKMNIPELLQI